MFQRILVVCIGNICRSPVAEHLLRDHLSNSDMVVESAGLRALVDKPMEAMAMQFLRRKGLHGERHRARQLTRGMLRSADLILAVEREHIIGMMRIAPESSGKIMLLDHWSGGRDIIDPYHHGHEIFDRSCQMIEHAVSAWLPRLMRQRQPLRP